MVKFFNLLFFFFFFLVVKLIGFFNFFFFLYFFFSVGNPQLKVSGGGCFTAKGKHYKGGGMTRLTLVMMGGGPYVPPQSVFIFLPKISPPDPPVNS